MLISTFGKTVQVDRKYPAGVFLLAVVLLLSANFGCGKRKAPLPPAAKVSQRAELSGFQRGDKVILSWKMPDRNAPANDVQHIRRIDVYRLVERTSSPLTLSEEQFSAQSVIISSISIKESDFGSKPLTYTDTLQFAGQPSRLRYAVRFVNASGQRAAFSNFLLIEPEAKVAAAPSSLSGEVSPDAINLEWTAPTANADGTTPVNLIGYNIYRSDSRTEAGKLLNRRPVIETTYSDESFEFEKEYFYFIRGISAGIGGAPTETAESEIVEVKPIDTFPPTPPSSLTIAASPTTISIFFPPNPEPDVVGYKIFRSEDDSIPKVDWKLMTSNLLETNTFQDTAVEADKTYYYYIIAVDKYKNESEPSEVVSDRLP